MLGLSVLMAFKERCRGISPGQTLVEDIIEMDHVAHVDLTDAVGVNRIRVGYWCW